MRFLTSLRRRVQKHATGIDFIEWNAGRNLDCHMKWEGFHISVRMDASTGLVFGGSAFNCGTWMDKMGSSLEHGTEGIPSSPRDGAAVEITGLLYSTLKWLSTLDSDAAPFKMPAQAVTLPDGTALTFTVWRDRIRVCSSDGDGVHAVLCGRVGGGTGGPCLHCIVVVCGVYFGEAR
jgi:glycogen debranching enzyme